MITKEEFDKLYDDNITKKEYNLIIEKIDKRFHEIINSMGIKVHDSWVDYDNYGNYGDAEGDGYFDCKRYKENIMYVGYSLNLPIGVDMVIPTRWLWEKEWEEDYKRIIEKGKKYMEDYENGLELQRKKVLEIQKSIESKLTKEELSYIQWR